MPSLTIEEDANAITMILQGYGRRGIEHTAQNRKGYSSLRRNN